MKPLIRGYLVMFGLLIIGGIAAWFVLADYTYAGCQCGMEYGAGGYVLRAFWMGVILGLIAGCWSAATMVKRQFLHTLLFGVITIAVGVGVRVATGSTRYPLERYDAFWDWVTRHGVTWFGNAVYYVTQWQAEAWLIPQLVAALVATAAIQFLRARHPAWVTRRRLILLAGGLLLVSSAAVVLTPLKNILLGNSVFPWEATVLLAVGADPNTESDFGVPILCRAAGWGDQGLVWGLIDRGANVRCADDGDDTPLHNAVRHGHLSVVRILVDHGARVNDFSTSSGTPLCVAAGGRDARIVRLLLSRGADTHIRSHNPLTPLCIAISTYSNGEIAEILLLRERSLKPFPADGSACLGYAARSGSLRMMKALLRKGAPVNAVRGVDPPICQAVAGRSLAATELLLARGADPNAVSQLDEGRTALYDAVTIGSEPILRLLLDHGANPNIRDNHGEAPLHVAAHNEPRMLEMLLAGGADVNACDERGQTALDVAMRGSTTAAVLLRHGARHGHLRPIPGPLGRMPMPPG